MKHLKWIVLGVVGLVVIALGIVFLSLNSIVRSTIETQATRSLDLRTTLDGASVSIFGGSLGLDDLKIASPQGFSAPRMFTLDDAKVGVSLGALRGDPVGIDRITLNEPVLVIEQADGRFNFQALMNQESKTPEAEQPLRLIIRELTVNDAKVLIRPGIPGLQEEVALPIPSFTVSDIGTGEGNKNGAAIKEVVMLVVTNLAEKASQSDQLPADVRQLLSLNIDQVKARVEAEIGKQIDKATKELTDKLPADVRKDVGQAVEKGIGDLLNRKEEPKDKQP